MIALSEEMVLVNKTLKERKFSLLSQIPHTQLLLTWCKYLTSC